MYKGWIIITGIIILIFLHALEVRAKEVEGQGGGSLNQRPIF